MYLCLLGLCSVSALCLGLLFLCVCVLCCVCWVFRLCSVSVVSLYVCGVCVYCVLCVLYLLRVCVFLCSVFVLLVTLLVWRLSWWCDGRLFFGFGGFGFLGGVACVEFFYFLFTVWCGWSSFVRFLLSHIFCGFLWGLCHTRNFFKDITHSYCGYVIPVMSLYMPLLAYLYHTRYCADIAPVYTCARVCLCLCSYLLASMSPLCFILCCPGIMLALHLVLCLLVLVVCFSMPWVTPCVVCLPLVLGGCAVWGMLLVVVCFTCWFYTPFFSYVCLLFLEGL